MKKLLLAKSLGSLSGSLTDCLTVVFEGVEPGGTVSTRGNHDIATC